MEPITTPNDNLKNDLRWRLFKNPDGAGTAWRADSVGGIKFNIVIDKAGTELYFVSPGGQLFVAMFETTENIPLADFKQYANNVHKQLILVRDISIEHGVATQKAIHAAEVEVAANKPRIILPGQH